jgi:hypothetical protein
MTTELDPQNIGQKIGQIPDCINTATASRVGDEIRLTFIVNGLRSETYVLAPHVAATVIEMLAQAMR